MNVGETIFSKCTALLCEYHIFKNDVAKCKTYSKVTDLKSKDGRDIKYRYVSKTTIDECEAIVQCDIEQAYVDNCRLYKIVCTNFPKKLEYVETTILELVKKKFVRY